MAEEETLDLDGVEVRFPYTPYEAQNAYMSKCVEALQSSCHAVLESPTGTGKTLCLLASVLAFREAMKSEVKGLLQSGNPNGAHMASVPKIIYASRTHSQLTQVVSELRKLRDVCGYFVDMSVIGGRSSTCLNPKVMKEKDQRVQQMMCSAACKARKCFWKTSLDRLPEQDYPAGIIDIEELVQFAQEKSVCAYYLGRSKAEKAEVLLLPYNYLLDEKLRKRHKIEVANRIVILDEAHNIENVCESASSYEITSTDIAGAIRHGSHIFNIILSSVIRRSLAIILRSVNKGG